MELKDLDLNLLVIFQHLLAERSVSKAGERLGLSQPAISNALARLRRLFGDELFLRTAQGMVPTPFADQLAGAIAPALGLIHGAVNQQSAFDPLTSTRRFSVGMTDIGEIYFLPVLMQALAQAAPQVSLTTVRNTSIDLKDAMANGQIDLAIGLLPQLRGGFFQRRLFNQRYVCLLRQGHRLDRGAMSEADFFAADHVVVVSEGTGHGRIDALIDRQGVQRRVRLTVPHFVAVGHILQSTDLLATVPERLAQRMMGPFGLTSVPHPVSLPEVAINVFWHAKFQKDPANQWLRGLVFDLHTDGAAPV